MTDGKLVEEGSPEGLYSSPCKDEVAEFLGCKNRMNAKLRKFLDKEGLALVETPIGEVNCYVTGNIKEGDEFGLYMRSSNVTIATARLSNRVNVLTGRAIVTCAKQE